MLMLYALYCRTMGCQLGDNCRFLHNVPGGYEAAAKMTNLEPQIAQSSKKTQTSSSVGSSSGREDPRKGSSFGASVTAKIIRDASSTGAIIGKDGNRTKQICHETGVKLSIVDYERAPNLKNVEIEGTYDQINEANGMMRELIRRFGSDAAHPARRSPYKS